MERTRGSFIRDLVIKIFLILLFVFLITLLFPMPNLTPFYNRIFNDNVQTMKEAAEDYFTKDRMPKNVGDSSKLTLQQMLDKKLVLPFLDKDGKECDTNKSYVKVTKKKKEYELEVHLTCGNESNYIIEPIGCYNFCPDNSCVKDITTDEQTGKVTINNNKVTPPSPSGDKYKLQYLYMRTMTTEKWTVGDWTTAKKAETKDLKLVDQKTQYTGQKKVTSGTTVYKHIKYAYRDKWSYDTDWTNEVKPITERVRLADTRTLYTGQKKIVEETEKYKHIKYAYKDNWKETGYQGTKYNTSDTVVLLGTRYTVRKTTQTSTGGWSGWVKDTTWRTSKPADTSTTQWSDAYNSRTTTTQGSKKLLYNSYESTTPLSSTSTRWYEFLYYDDVPCKTACTSSTVRVYFYRVYEITQGTSKTEYQYMYRTYSSSATSNVDEKVVTDPTPYTQNGYAIIKYEYNYKINTREKYIADTLWTTSRTSPAGYEYANEKKITRVTRYVNLNKWVTSPDALGEYTYNVTTRKQYKYKYNNPEKYIKDTIWTTSITPPTGYVYSGESKTTSKTTYVDLGRWVDSKAELGEYTYNIQTRTLYKYKTRTTATTTEYKWFDSNPGGNWVYANKTRKVKVN